jgi:cholesterol oxidase
MMMTQENSYDFIVIGTGFGGAVSALRLAQKGYRVAVLEKGLRYRSSDFPDTNWQLRKSVWLPQWGLLGIQALTLLRHVLVLHGVGVGGVRRPPRIPFPGSFDTKYIRSDVNHDEFS